MDHGIVGIDLESLQIVGESLTDLMLVVVIDAQIHQGNGVGTIRSGCDRGAELLDRLLFLPLFAKELSQIDMRRV